MTRYVFEGTGEVWLVPTISSPGAPTASELNAGTDLTGQLIGDLTLPFDGTTADAADASSKFNKTVSGDFGGGSGSFTIHKEKVLADDTVFTALPRDTVGYLCVNQRGLTTSGTWATGDEVDVWPIEVMSREVVYSRGTTQRAVITVAITDVPTEDFVVVA